MTWGIEFLEEAEKDLRKLDHYTGSLPAGYSEICVGK